MIAGKQTLTLRVYEQYRAARLTLINANQELSLQDLTTPAAR